jgi:hypothetical protein
LDKISNSLNFKAYNPVFKPDSNPKYWPVITLKYPFNQILGMQLLVCFALTLASYPVRAAILGQLPVHGDILYITTEPCTAENGRVEPNWFFSYSVNSLGSVTRSCYVLHNDQVWIKGPYGAESTFPMSLFKKPAVGASQQEPGSGVKQ